MSTARGAAVGGRRRRPVSDDEARRRRTMLLAGLACVAAVAGCWWMVTGPPGRIGSVSVSGYDRPDKALVTRYVTAVAERGTVIDPPVAAIRRLQIRFPWIEDVRASRALPRGLDVEIVQATPGAILVPSRGPKMVVSGTGRVLGPAAGVSAAVPRVRIAGDAPAAGTRITSPVVAAALEFSGALDAATARRVLALHRANGALVGRLSGGPELRLGLPEDLPQKAAALELVLGQLSPTDERTATYIDLSVPSRPAVGNLVPSTQTSSASTSPPPSTSTPSTAVPSTGVPVPAPAPTGPGSATPSQTTTPQAATTPSTSTAGGTTGGAPPAPSSSGGTPAPATGGTAAPVAGGSSGATTGSLPGTTSSSGAVPPPAP